MPMSAPTWAWQRSHRVLMVCLTLCALASTGLASDRTRELDLRGVQVGLDRSPARFVAAVIHAVGVPKCTDPEVEATCIVDVKLVEIFASRGGEFGAGTIVSLRGGGATGSRYLAFLAPVESRPGVYGATFLSIDPSADDRAAFVAALKKAGL